MHAAVTTFNEFLKSKIKESDSHYRTRDNKEFQQYLTLLPEPAPTSLEEVIGATDDANIIFTSSDHSLESNFATELVKRYGGPETTLYIEFVSRQHQAALDKYLKGSITDEMFCRRINFLRWNFPWESVAPLLDAAKETKTNVIAANEDETGMARRNRRIAKNILEGIVRRPTGKHLVNFGEQHVIPIRLPDLVSRGAPDLKRAIVMQDQERWYWTIMSQDWRKNAAKVTDELYCIFRVSPVIANLRHYGELEREDSLDQTEAYQNALDECIELFFKFFGLENTEEGTPYVIEPDSVVSEKEIATYLRRNPNLQYRFQSGVPIYIPRLNKVILGNTTLPYVGEPAMEFVADSEKHLVGKREVKPKQKADLFWSTVETKTFGYFGSKILNPLRTPQENAMVTPWNLALFEQDAVQLDHRSPEYEKLSMLVGYNLGEQLFQSFADCGVTRRMIGQMASERLNKPGVAYRQVRELCAVANQ